MDSRKRERERGCDDQEADIRYDLEQNKIKNFKLELSIGYLIIKIPNDTAIQKKR